MSLWVDVSRHLSIYILGASTISSKISSRPSCMSRAKQHGWSDTLEACGCITNCPYGCCGPVKFASDFHCALPMHREESLQNHLILLACEEDTQMPPMSTLSLSWSPDAPRRPMLPTFLSKKRMIAGSCKKAMQQSGPCSCAMAIRMAVCHHNVPRVASASDWMPT